MRANDPVFQYSLSLNTGYGGKKADLKTERNDKQSDKKSGTKPFTPQQPLDAPDTLLNPGKSDMLLFYQTEGAFSGLQNAQDFVQSCLLNSTIMLL